MLRIEHLTVPPLAPVSLELADGACLAVMGPSGSGKTRLLRAIADLDPAEGRVSLDGEERCEMPAYRWRRLVRFVAAEPAWWTDRAREAFPTDDGVASRAARLADALGLDETLLDRPLNLLSTGERQRLALVRAVADQPRVLLLDEPTSALDPANAALTEELIRYQLLSGRIVLLSSHDHARLDRLATLRLDLSHRTEKPRSGVYRP